MGGLGRSVAVCCIALALGSLCVAQGHLKNPVRTFEIEDDRFWLDGKPLQILSGSIHYFRIHPAYWKDRLMRMKAMGLNAITFYIPWNFHEPYPGQYKFEGMADLEAFLDIVKELGFVALARPGPYICAEWDFGGFPWWFSSSLVQGGRTMKLRTNDPDYIRLVDRWWNVLLPKLKPYLYEHGGPIVMVQVENEYGFCQLHDVPYLRHLVTLVRNSLGNNVVVYTTDPPNKIKWGTIKGGEVYSVVDFGPKWFDLNDAFGQQRELNKAGKSPPFCSEFYPGWLTHWGEPIANTSVKPLMETFNDIMKYANGTGSVNFYMAHGGTNFGYWSGAGIDKTNYVATITSYDYDCMISEAGGYDQPGVGGDGNKYELVRGAILKHTGATAKDLPTIPADPVIVSYGDVEMNESVGIFKALNTLYPGDGITAQYPDIMEEYGQSAGLILYRTFVPNDRIENSVLDITSEVHDFAHVLVNGKVMAKLDRSHPQNVTLAPVIDKRSSDAVLDILVHALGRVNFGCVWDNKGLSSPDVKLDGEILEGWHVFTLPLDDPSQKALGFQPIKPQTLENAKKDAKASEEGNKDEAAAEGEDSKPESDAPLKISEAGPAFYRGTFTIESNATRVSEGHLADTFLSVKGWNKGLAWINGFNLGWYWPTYGPQVTYYIPGPLLNPGKNELIMLELEENPKTPKVSFVTVPDFSGGIQASKKKGAATEGEIGVVSRREYFSREQLLPAYLQ